MLLAGLLVPSASAQFGVAAGLNYDSISDISSEDLRGSFGNASGYHIGVFFDLGVGPIALRVGAFYRDLGEFDISVASLRESVSLSAVDFPVDLRFSVLPTPIIRPYIMAGPVFSLAQANDKEFDASLEGMTVAGNIGVGLEMHLGGMTLFPELRYAIGVTNLIKDRFPVGNAIITSGSDQRTNTAMLRLGIAF